MIIMTRFVRFVATRITKLLLNNRLPLRCTKISPKILSPGIILFKMKKYISTQLENDIKIRVRNLVLANAYRCSLFIRLNVLLNLQYFQLCGFFSPTILFVNGPISSSFQTLSYSPKLRHLGYQCGLRSWQ